MSVPGRPASGLPSAPWSTVLTAAAGAGVLLAAVGLPRASLVAAGIAAAVCTVLLVRRARLSHAERAVWLRWACCAPAIALSVGLAWWGAPVAAVVCVVGVFPLAYGATVRWNRYATSLADPHEAINGAASMIALVAVADLVTQLTGSGPSELPWLQRLLVFTPIACSAIIFLSLAAVIPAAGLARDGRAWLLMGAVALVVVLTAAGLLGLSLAAVGAVLATTAWCAGYAAHLPPGTLSPRPVKATDSTVGGFVILLACTSTLLIEVLTATQGLSSWLAAVAATLGAIRLLRNVHDISALSTSRQEAMTDELTGIPNRRGLLRRAGELTAAGRPMVLAVVDLDGFKHINDSLGHAAGDQLLRQTAHRLRAALPDGDLLGRLGGDEFAVLAPLQEPAQAGDRMELLGRQLSTALTEPADIGGFLVHGSGSIGITTSAVTLSSTSSDAVTSHDDVSELLRQADAAMYQAKATRGSVVVYDSAVHAAHGHLQLVEELHSALQDGQLVLHHQPQVEVATGRLVGVEALVRWNHPTRGLLAPAAFLDVAESQGLMGRLTDHVLDEAVSQLATWRTQGLLLRMSINLSASNLLDTALPARLSTLLAAHGVQAADLTLEVTESVLVQDSASTSATLHALSATGVDLSIDDFGTGWSSLAYLRRLPARELKLDRSFTRDLLTDPRTDAIVESTIRLAHQLGLRVVAEGVEDPSTLGRLRSLDCDISQGYLHARPMPAAQLRRWAHLHHPEDRAHTALDHLVAASQRTSPIDGSVHI